MNRVLVTGLGCNFDNCAICNTDLAWLIKYPSVFLWADKIILTPTMWETIRNYNSGIWLNKSPELAKSIKLILEMAQTEKLIEIINPSTVISEELERSIYAQAEEDKNIFLNHYPRHAKLCHETEGHLLINGRKCCAPRVWTAYAGLILSRVWEAQCLFNDSILEYCQFKFNLLNYHGENFHNKIKGFENVFQAYIPNEPILPEYVLIDRDGCNNCSKMEQCKDGYLGELEKNFKELIQWRDYDEIHEMKSVFNDIVAKRNQLGESLKAADIINDFESIRNKLRKRVKLVFPRVRRWTNLTTMISIPIAIAGTATGNSLFTFGGVAVAGISRIGKELVDMFANKYSWIGFTNKKT